jgi:hypothetical protein
MTKHKFIKISVGQSFRNQFVGVKGISSGRLHEKIMRNMLNMKYIKNWVYCNKWQVLLKYKISEKSTEMKKCIALPGTSLRVCVLGCINLPLYGRFVPGRFVPLPFRPLAISSPCRFVPLPFRPLAVSSPCRFVPITFRPHTRYRFIYNLLP